MVLYSHNQGFPAELPFQYLDRSTGVNYTSLSERDAFVHSMLGFEIAPDAPVFDPDIQKIAWNGTGWGTTALSREEIDAIKVGVRVGKKADVKNQHAVILAAGISRDLGTGFFTFQATTDALTEVQTLRDDLAPAETIEVVTEVDDVVELNKGKCVLLIAAIVAFRKAAAIRQSALYREVEAAVDLAAVRAVNTSVGWPT